MGDTTVVEHQLKAAIANDERKTFFLNMLTNLLLCPDLNQIFISCFRPVEVWQLRSVCQTLAKEIPNELHNITICDPELLHMKFPNVRKVSLKRLDDDPIHLSVENFPKLQRVEILSCAVPLLQIDCPIQELVFQDDDDHIEQFQLLWSSLKTLELQSESLWPLFLSANLCNLTKLKLHFPVDTQLLSTFFPSLAHLEFPKGKRQKHVVLPDLPLQTVVVRASSDCTSVHIPNSTALESLKVYDHVQTVYASSLPLLRELKLDVNEFAWEMPNLQYLRLWSDTCLHLHVSKQCPNIQHLHVDHVHVHLDHCESLETLSMYESDLLGLVSVPSLKNLTIRHGKICTDGRQTFPSLETCHVQVEDAQPVGLWEMPVLKQLKIDFETPFTMILSKQCPKIEKITATCVHLNLEHCDALKEVKMYKSDLVACTDLPSLQRLEMVDGIIQVQEKRTFPLLQLCEVIVDDIQPLECWAMPELNEARFSSKTHRTLDLSKQCPKVTIVDASNIDVLAKQCVQLEDVRMDTYSCQLPDAVRTLHVKVKNGTFLQGFSLPNVEHLRLKSEESCVFHLLPNMVHVETQNVNLIATDNCPKLEYLEAHQCSCLRLKGVPALKTLLLFDSVLEQSCLDFVPFHRLKTLVLTLDEDKPYHYLTRPRLFEFLSKMPNEVGLLRLDIHSKGHVRSVFVDSFQLGSSTISQYVQDYFFFRNDHKRINKVL